MTAAPVDYRHTPCPDCDGDGTTLDAGLPAWCPTCDGTVYDPDGTLTTDDQPTPCPTCDGHADQPKPSRGRRLAARFSDWPEAALALAVAITATLIIFGRRDYDSVPALLVCFAVYVPTYIAAAAARKRVAR